MENALWNGKIYLAFEISKNYILEKDIRKASGRKELHCPDTDCQHPVLRYCHGEKKEAYFAHLNNISCDYAKFDNENTQVMRKVRGIIYENFRKKGYSVKQEAKILPHHYTHLLFDNIDGKQVAVEIGTQRLSANKMDLLTNKYKNTGIDVKWIVLGNTDIVVKENHTFFIKRYLLNESKNKDLIVVNWDCSEVAQFKTDLNKYDYNGSHQLDLEYPETYSEHATLGDLEFVGKELCIKGYKERYRDWLKRKATAYNKEITQHENRQRRYIEEIQNIKQVRNQYCKNDSQSINKEQKNMYDKCKKEVLPIVGQEQTPVCDSMERYWAKCKKCGRIDTGDKFPIRRGSLGICDNCIKYR